MRGSGDTGHLPSPPAGGQGRRRWPVGLAVAGLLAAGAFATPARHSLAVLAATLGGPPRPFASQSMLGPVSGHAQTFSGTPPVGALFTLTSRHRLGSHFCTATVVDSPGRDMLITAAHCVSGTPLGAMVFVPGFHDGEQPYGVWPITRIAVDPAWAASGDPDDDVAFLITSRPGAKIQDVTGGERLGLSSPATGVVRVVGYPVTASAPIRCANRVGDFGATQLRFDCTGYSTGTSGSALLADVSHRTGLGAVVGVIGGYELGGNTASVSYAARFTPRVATLYRTASSLSRPLPP